MDSSVGNTFALVSVTYGTVSCWVQPAGYSPIGESVDNAAYDLTLDGARQWSSRITVRCAVVAVFIWITDNLAADSPGSLLHVVCGVEHGEAGLVALPLAVDQHAPLDARHLGADWAQDIRRAQGLTVFCQRFWHSGLCFAQWGESFVAEEWFENDGMCSTFSQYHPFECAEGKCEHRRTHIERGAS